MSRIFMSHSSRDNREAVALKHWLAEQDPPLANEIFLDLDPASGLRTGTRWKDALRRANARCEAVICLLSPNWERSHECKVEYRTAENLNKQIFCARLEPSTGDDLTSEWQRCDLFGDGPTTRIDVDDGPPVVFSTEGLYRLRDGIRGAGIGADSFVWPPPGDPERAPYRGWAPLEEADAAVFFGRDAQIVRALDAVRGMRLSGVNPLFVVLGPSGTGKSSFLRAGLLPRLRREDRRFVLMDIVRPDRDALLGASGFAAALSATRSALGLRHPSLGEIKQACTAGDVGTVAGWLGEVRQEAGTRLLERGGDTTGASAPTLVMPLDQAEELFAADAGAAATDFLHLLAGLVDALNAEDLGIVVAATIRTDRYEVMQTHPALAGVGTVLFDELKPMPPTQFKEVITGPAQRASDAGRPLRVAPDLVDRLLADASGGGDTLPILALTLSRLYTDYGGTGELTLAGYEALGGMRRVVQTEIDEVLAEDPVRRAVQLDALKSAFIPWLATINPDNDQPMRRVARWSDLPAPSRPLIDALVAKRLMVKDNRDGQVVVEVALESLLRQWDELAGWLREERKDLKDADDLERAASAWAASGRNPAWLLEGTRLTEATALVNKPGFSQRLTGTHPYLNASHQREGQRRTEDEQQRQAELLAAQERAQHAQERQATAEAHTAALRKRSRVMRAVLVGTALVAVVAVAASVWATVSRGEAQSRFRQATGIRLASEADAMVAGSRGGGDIRAIQQLLAADALNSGADASSLYSAVTARSSTLKIIPTGFELKVAAYSPDGDRVAAGGDDGTLWLWDTASGDPIGDPLSGGDGDVGPVTFSGDGKLIATGDDSGTIRLRNADTGEQIGQPLTGHTDGVASLAFSPDGSTLASGGLDGARLWDVNSRRQLGEPHTAQGSIRYVGFNSNGTLLATGSADDGTVQLWEPISGAPLGAPLADANPDTTLSMTMSRDGSRIAIGHTNGDIYLLDTQTRQPVGEPFKGPMFGAISMAFSPDGKRLAVGGTDKTVQIWDTEAGTSIGDPMLGHDQYVMSVAFGPDGQRLVSGGRDGTIRVWDLTKTLVGHTAGIATVAYNPSGDRLASGGEDGTVRLWDVRTGQQVGNSIAVDATAVAGVAFTADGDKLITGATDGTLAMWNPRTGQPAGEPVSTGMDGVSSFALSPDKTIIALGSSDGTVKLWNADSGRAVGGTFSDSESLVGSVAIDGSNRMVAAVTAEGTTLWNAENGDVITRLHTGLGREAIRVAFSPDGATLASASLDSVVRQWNPQTGEPIGEEFPGHGDMVLTVAYSPDGHRLASGGVDRTVRLWDVASGREIGDPLRGHGREVFAITFSPDGRTIASAGMDGTVRLWPATAAPEDLCAKLTQNMSRKQWNEWVSPDIDYIQTCPGLPIAAD